jgi:hypothetical protein
MLVVIPRRIESLSVSVTVRAAEITAVDEFLHVNRVQDCF